MPYAESGSGAAHDAEPAAPRFTIAQRAGTVFRGMLIGTADVIPGVSGGTIALIVGIYTRLVDAVRSLNLAWLPAALRLVASGFRAPAARARTAAHWRRMDATWLSHLMAGVLLAFAIGTIVLPKLLQQYPTEMRGLFFGLIAASLVVPARLILRDEPDAAEKPRRELGAASWTGIGACLIAAAVGAYALLGASADPPQTAREVVVKAGPAPTLEAVVRENLSLQTPQELFRSLPIADRRRLADANPDIPVAVTPQPRLAGEKPHHTPYDDLRVPAGTTLTIASPPIWVVFVAGLVAICAMILPGISGSFILLMGGMYYFVVGSAARGFLHGLKSGRLLVDHIIVLGVFAVGCVVGLVVFSRLLSWMLHHLRRPLLAALAGLMLGSLRLLWPYKAGSAASGNTAPDPANLLPLGLAAIGAVVVLGLVWWGERGAAAPKPA
jgi:uncharacterized membrane protein